MNVRRSMLNWCKSLPHQTVLHAQNAVFQCKRGTQTPFHAPHRHPFSHSNEFQLKRKSCLFVWTAPPRAHSIAKNVPPWCIHYEMRMHMCGIVWMEQQPAMTAVAVKNQKSLSINLAFSSVWKFIRLKQMRRYQQKVISFCIICLHTLHVSNRRQKKKNKNDIQRTDGRTFHSGGLVWFIEYTIY